MTSLNYDFLTQTVGCLWLPLSCILVTCCHGDPRECVSLVTAKLHHALSRGGREGCAEVAVEGRLGESGAVTNTLQASYGVCVGREGRSISSQF